VAPHFRRLGSGLGIPGGLIAGVLTGAWVARWRGLPVAQLLDVVAPAIPVAQAIGRLGNWFNEELYGRPVVNEQLNHALNTRIVIEQAKAWWPNAAASTCTKPSPACVATPATTTWADVARDVAEGRLDTTLLPRT